MSGTAIAAPSGLRSAGAFLSRDVTLLRRSMASIVSALVVPGLFMVCLYEVFGYAAEGIGLDYATFLFAGCLVQAALFTGAASSMAVAVDLDSGLIDRVRIHPRSTIGYLLGRVGTDLLRMCLSSLTVIAVGLACGMDDDAGHIARACLWGLAVAIMWGVLTTGAVLTSRHPIERADLIQTLEMVVILFSTTFIPAASLSGTLKDVVTHVPLSPMIEVIRQAMGTPLENSTTRAEAVFWILALLLAGLAMTVHALRGRTRR